MSKIYNGWKKATQNISKEEANRLWDDAVSIINMIRKWKSMSDELKKCKQGAKIYYKAVDTFGVYAYRSKSEPYCKEQCAETLGKPNLNSTSF